MDVKYSELPDYIIQYLAKIKGIDVEEDKIDRQTLIDQIDTHDRNILTIIN